MRLQKYWLLLLLSACASVQTPEEVERNYPYRDVSRVLQRVRATFPEAPDAYFSIHYQAGKVNNKAYLGISQIRLYWPANQSTAPVLGRFRQLMQEFQFEQLECLSVETGREVHFTGLSDPLREIVLDTACG
ncbi:hypothetical protein COW36_24200 [bacterium (Candidatus Blackallbacteria) CG17_big_fil_post_rev_8_21_14_2_50_48_46]|uniref:Uncharacterized protein n=1 Tax=bacterium (Candidatus Blackallbacteria) CG17_big_fil_post_rev_8_21_14_2_50_48_46 TaxID=2014261 RepID=A0A2M7FXQ2_9BACT|nr:MAG: hypothetical protein COW64_19140 [bacterium (Candidatus Blackallbacteria) CG18_big_fil_WC_8_21_14_2_50_49_26]PIW13773.1 MAG: hypothetical protein COW36_24200 [bacterium (Candidatus Blackallbacteria) CG17_big_fil_post_rev_8_21_14_2_50_48_46]PIW44999.1 MAG: hypothetical protein COW20_21830 [bacterium (Candidatus Blackallbacteria) CG13_big_fil_rev_8_21_14_2_50_49_14]